MLRELDRAQDAFVFLENMISMHFVCGKGSVTYQRDLGIFVV